MIITRDKSFYRSLVLLTLPIALQNLITFSVGLADNIMVGRLGDAAVSGVFIGGQVQTLLQVFSAGIESAMLIIAAQYWGKRDAAGVRRMTAIGLRFCFFFALPVMLLCLAAPTFIVGLFSHEAEAIAIGADYLRILCLSFPFFALTQGLIAAMRSVETARIGMMVSLISLVVNVCLNWIFIFGNLGFPAMGARGAALATLLSRICEFAFISVYVLRIDKKLRFSLRDLRGVDKNLLHDFIRYGTPIMVGQLVWAVNMLASSAIMGRHKAEGVVTALSLANTANSLAYVVINGMAGAVGIITGKTIGSGRTDKLREYAYTVQAIFIVLAIITGSGVRLIRDGFISLYNISPAAVAQAKDLINVLSVTIMGTCYQMPGLFGLVKSGGDVTFVMRMDLVFVFLVVLPLACIALHLGAAPALVFFLLKCDQLLKCIVAAVKINRFKWIRDLTR